MYASKKFFPLKSSYRNVTIEDDAIAVIGTLALVHGSIGRNTSQNRADFINARITIINMLLDAGASMNCQNIDGHTALDLATQTGWRAVSSMLWRRSEMHGEELDEASVGDLSDSRQGIIGCENVTSGRNSVVFIGHLATMAVGPDSETFLQGYQELHCKNITVMNAKAIMGSCWSEDKNFLESLGQYREDRKR
jgi:hypothetical protein